MCAVYRCPKIDSNSDVFCTKKNESSPWVFYFIIKDFF